MFTQAIAAILELHCTPAAVRDIERGGSTAALFDALSEAGFLELLAPEEQGGGGASWRDFFEVVLLCGAHAVPLPLAQTMATRLLVADPGSLPAGAITFAPALQREPDGSLRALQVPCGLTAGFVMGALEGALLLLPVVAAERLPSGIHNSLSASFHWPVGVGQALHNTEPAVALAPLAALIHAGMLAGAMKRCFDMTMAYANERVQFGKPIGKFQAIQHLLSEMAEQVAAGRMAAEVAFCTTHRMPTLAACAVAKARTSEAAQRVAATAHAVHGAIGMTAEYDLQLYTRRLHEWRVAHGSELHWHRLLGRQLMESPQPHTADFVRSVWEGAAA